MQSTTVGGSLSSLADVCALLGIPVPAGDSALTPVFPLRRVRAGTHLIHGGQAFDALYVVKVGFLKSSLIGACGTENPIAFPISGDLIGTDALTSGTHPGETIALTDCEIVVLPVEDASRIMTRHKALAGTFLRALARELEREQSVIGMLRMHSPEARLSHFLLEHGQSMKSIGFSDREFLLPMTRRDIGNYLSLRLETVSRTFALMAKLGLLMVKRRWIRIIDIGRLRELDHFAYRPRIETRRQPPAAEIRRDHAPASRLDFGSPTIHRPMLEVRP